MWSVWAICSFCPTPLEQAAQVLLPRHVREDTARAIKEAATPNAQKGDPASMPPGFVASREFVKCLALVGVATGMLLGTITAVVARHPHWLTPDTALYGIMASFTPYMMASLVMAGICIFLDGVLQAVGDLQYLCKSQAINVLALWLCLYGYVKQSGVGIIGVSLPPARLLSHLFSRSKLRHAQLALSALSSTVWPASAALNAHQLRLPLYYRQSSVPSAHRAT